MAFHSHGRLGETVPAGGRNGRDGLSAPSGEGGSEVWCDSAVKN
jgi:hypothetical protein